nr:MAG TPA: hypothetical protein [Bacteriophage sp.]
MFFIKLAERKSVWVYIDEINRIKTPNWAIFAKNWGILMENSSF